MKARQARIYDGLALLTAVIVIAFDQWTKALIVQRLSPPESQPPIPLLGNYLTIYYIRNSGAAFSLFANNVLLVLLIVAAIAVISFLYVRTLNTGSLAYKVILGLILGGAFGNLIDRVHHSGYVVDFIYFRIPQIGFRFAIFNLADAAISIGVFLLFVVIMFSGLQQNQPRDTINSDQVERENATLQSTKQDAQP